MQFLGDLGANEEGHSTMVYDCPGRFMRSNRWDERLIPDCAASRNPRSLLMCKRKERIRSLWKRYMQEEHRSGGKRHRQSVD
ncbi:hypothetical protein WN55_00272 [Dufourea novaeangliae]|uniref:Uncharacterized protein n=1 Tax=Dufourea novaeangliae TaxID=178035 RepID=A0A154PEG4_DUFNO|nr:hypothetical protein WN55_00272 [Dufourea novaeangliae]